MPSRALEQDLLLVGSHYISKDKEMRMTSMMSRSNSARTKRVSFQVPDGPRRAMFGQISPTIIGMILQKSVFRDTGNLLPVTCCSFYFHKAVIK